MFSMGDFLNQENSADIYLSKLMSNYNEKQIISRLSELKNVKVLVIGDTIIDEYAYCDNLERAKKEPILVFKYKYSEDYAGGILAIANHLAEFSDNVTLATHLGNDNLTKEIIEKNLNKKINRKFFVDSEYPTLVKRRYISSYTNNKAFEVYNKDPDLINLPEEKILEYLNDVESFDLVVVGDFGHGFVTDKIKDCLSQKSKYLAVNVQTNSGNIGFNLITKFERADYISITAEELQLAMRDKNSDLRELTKKLSDEVNCKRISITLGKSGLLYFENGIFHYAPIFSDKTVDTVGAGDAVFSVTSLMTSKGIGAQLIPFVGNCVGALAVKIIGNKEPVRAEKLREFISELLNNRPL
jgi:rfaE bifunctional protein kinase chain/domain